jgi:hypothetical protein
VSDLNDAVKLAHLREEPLNSYRLFAQEKKRKGKETLIVLFSLSIIFAV